MLSKAGVEKLFSSLDTKALREISVRLMICDHDLNDYYKHPDILSKILKEMYGKYYVRLIASI